MDWRTALKGVEKMENVSEYDDCPDQDWERQLEEVRLIFTKSPFNLKNKNKKNSVVQPCNGVF